MKATMRAHSQPPATLPLIRQRMTETGICPCSIHANLSRAAIVALCEGRAALVTRDLPDDYKQVIICDATRLAIWRAFNHLFEDYRESSLTEARQ